MTETIKTEVVVIGAGPGGYAAAFRAADLGKKVVLIDKDTSLGGVCLNRGCIPSKALLHLTKLIVDSKEAKNKGVVFEKPKINIKEIRRWKNTVISKLSSGIFHLAKARKVKTLTGTARLRSANELELNNKKSTISLFFEKAIIATGSVSRTISTLPEDPNRIIGSKQALELHSIPKNLLVVGGGYIGLEMGSVYSALGARVTVVERLPHLLTEIDQDLVKPLQRKLSLQLEKIYLKSTLVSGKETKKGINITLKTPNGEIRDTYDKVLVSVGRKPNTENLGLENAGIEADKKGFLPVDKFQRTTTQNIYAIGDVVGNPMLAHKAAYEGTIAAEHIAGLSSQFDARAIPAVVFTNPEIAWVGLTETKAKEDSIYYKKGEFPWTASGKAIIGGFQGGKTKILFNPETKQVLGAGIVGQGAGDLVSEIALAIEMGADAEDLRQTIHPHPTLSETIRNSAETFLGTATDIFVPKTNKQEK
jgi:dihydrolipoamide dehydrogenase